MKKYKVNVNGSVYEIEIEEITGSEVSTSKTTVTNAPVKQPTPTTTVGSEKIQSPMPGSITCVNVSVGSIVKKGDILLVLEAMKMENEIMSPADGKVTQVAVEKGATVETGTLLCVIS